MGDSEHQDRFWVSPLEILTQKLWGAPLESAHLTNHPEYFVRGPSAGGQSTHYSLFQSNSCFGLSLFFHVLFRSLLGFKALLWLAFGLF